MQTRDQSLFDKLGTAKICTNYIDKLSLKIHYKPC